MAETPAVCEHLHLPLQSGSARILRAMQRGYTPQRFLDRLAMMRAAVPGLATTTDVIVGFPGETEADFRATLAVVEEAALRRRLHVRVLAAARHPGGGHGRSGGPGGGRRALRPPGRPAAAPVPGPEPGTGGQEVEVLAEGPSRKDP